MEEKVNICLLQ